MKKIIAVSLILILIGIYNSLKLEAFKIPDEAIRLRVIANSNSVMDQSIKMEVKEKLEEKIFLLLENIDNVVEANQIIENNLDLFNTEVYQILKDNNYRLDYGMNFFPEKEYKGITYDEGYYQSLVVTIGEGAGDNWWCVLFPPLCLLEAEESSEVEYKFFVQELIDNIFNR